MSLRTGAEAETSRKIACESLGEPRGGPGLAQANTAALPCQRKGCLAGAGVACQRRHVGYELWCAETAITLVSCQNSQQPLLVGDSAALPTGARGAGRSSGVCLYDSVAGRLALAPGTCPKPKWFCLRSPLNATGGLELTEDRTIFEIRMAL